MTFGREGAAKAIGLSMLARVPSGDADRARCAKRSLYSLSSARTRQNKTEEALCEALWT